MTQDNGLEGDIFNNPYEPSIPIKSEEDMIAEVLGSNAENLRLLGDLLELHNNRISSLEHRIDTLEQVKVRTPYKA